MKYDRSKLMFMIGELHKMLGREFDIRGPFHIAYEETLNDVAKRMKFKSGDEQYQNGEYIHRILTNGDAGDLGYVCRVVKEMKDELTTKSAIQYGPSNTNSHWGGVVKGEAKVETIIPLNDSKKDDVRDAFERRLKEYGQKAEEFKDDDEWTD